MYSLQDLVDICLNDLADLKGDYANEVDITNSLEVFKDSFTNLKNYCNENNIVHLTTFLNTFGFIIGYFESEQGVK